MLALILIIRGTVSALLQNLKEADGDEAKKAAAMGGAAAAAALGGPYAASTLLYSLWRDPSVAAFALQTWGTVDGLVFPAGTGRP